MDIYQILNQLEVDYKYYEHPAVFHCDDANKLDLNIEGLATKNLFLKDKKGKQHFLVVLASQQRVDLKQLAQKLEVSRLSFASPERLTSHLLTEPGSVSILDILKDNTHQVTLVIDRNVVESDSFQCHPYTNTATLDISTAGVKKLLNHYQRQFKTVELSD